MKNKLFIILLFVISILTINIVKAKEGPFALDWQTKPTDDSFSFLNYPYQNGYATVDLNSTGNKSILKTYDINGKNLKTYNTDRLIIDLKAKGKELYTLEFEQPEYPGRVPGEFSYYEQASDPLRRDIGVEEALPYEFSYYIVLYNDKLEKIKEQKIDELKMVASANFIDTDLFGMYITDDQVIIAAFTIYISLDRDLSNKEKTTIEQIEDLAQYSNILPIIDSEQYLRIVMNEDGEIKFDNNDNYTIIVDNKDCNPKEAGCVISKLILFSNDGEIVWNKEYQNDSYITDVAISNDYIIVSIANELQSRIEIYDLKGKLVQTINSKLCHAFINKTPFGFIVSDTILYYAVAGIRIHIKDDSDPSNNEQATFPFKSNHQVYYLAKNIKTKVKAGEGTIKVLTKARINTEVTFEVTPKAGYKVAGVTITNSKGETITFTKNIFTMPNDDVTIEVEFVKKITNPETTDIAVLTLTIISFITVVSFTIYYKKMEFLQ